MAKPSSSSQTDLESLEHVLSSTATISKDITKDHLAKLLGFFENVGVSAIIPDHCNSKDFYSDVVHGVLKPLTVLRGQVTCLFSVKPVVANFYGGLHGGACAAIAEVMAIACAKTVVANEKELFLGELSVSYLSAAPKEAEVIADGRVVRSGRNLTVVAVDFKLKKTNQLIYTARATFYNMPSSNSDRGRKYGA